MFPVDGQHRVEGIKAALIDNPELKSNTIGAIFIGHSTDAEGMQKSRRLFTTLNRYAKPVTMDDIIALDEDDSIAIVTRSLLENFQLFSGKNVTKSKNKAIPDTDKNSITSIITLYQCNRELLKLFRKKRKTEAPNSSRDKKSFADYLKFRPEEEEIRLFKTLISPYQLPFHKISIGTVYYLISTRGGVVSGKVPVTWMMRYSFMEILNGLIDHFEVSFQYWRLYNLRDLS